MFLCKISGTDWLKIGNLVVVSDVCKCYFPKEKIGLLT